MAATAQHIPGVGTVYLAVGDQDRALTFYRDGLGFVVRTDTMVGEGFGWVEVAPAGAYTVIALVPPTREEDPLPGGQAPFGFDTPNLEAAMAEFSSRGVEFEDVVGAMVLCRRWRTSATPTAIASSLSSRPPVDSRQHLTIRPVSPRPSAPSGHLRDGRSASPGGSLR